jgi:DNA-binding winged helix-turn-helix (wHTH) protein
MTQHPESQFQLGELLVSPSHNEIILGDKRLTLQPKVMAVLHYLAQHQDRVVSGDELLSELWKGRIVTPGSVQKSINSLRKAFAEFCGDQEMIVHYSKRGYQLVIAPVFLDSPVSPEESEQPALSTSEAAQGPSVSRAAFTRKFIWAGVALVVCVTVLLLTSWKEQPLEETPFIVKKEHQTRFTASREFINNKFREILIRPHPNNQHLAYVRQRLQSEQEWEIDSQLMIKNLQGEDWQIALSHGSWDLLAWSPDGQYPLLRTFMK